MTDAAEDHPGCQGVLAVGGLLVVVVVWVLIGSAGSDFDGDSLNRLGWGVSIAWVASLLLVALFQRRGSNRG
jgi:hypothetical protein